MLRPVPPPQKIKEKKKKTILVSILVCAVLSFFIYGILWVFGHPSLQVRSIKVEGNKILASSEVEQGVRATLAGKYFYIVPKTFILFYPEKKIVSSLLSDFPRIAVAAVSLDDKKNLTVAVRERDAAGIWCGEKETVFEPSASSTDDAPCYYLDASGFIFDTSPRFSGDAYFVFYGKGLLEKKEPIGQNLVSGETFEKIMELRQFIGKYGNTIVSASLGKDAYVELVRDDGMKILIFADQDIPTLESNMQAVFRSPSWQHDHFKGTGGEAGSPIEYLDFRFGNKVFYRYEGEIASSTAAVP